MIKKMLSLGVAGVFMLSVFAGCATGKKVETTPAPATSKTEETKAPEKKDEKQIVLRLAEVHPEDYPTTQGDKEFAKLVEERTNGRIKIEVYASGQLGDEKSVIEQVQFGAIDFARVSLSPMSEFAKKLNVLQLPYIYRSADHMWKVLNGPIGQEYLEALSVAKLVGLNYYDGGSRNFYNTKKEIKSIEDLKGMKFRVMQSALNVAMVEALGGVATPMAYGEVYSSLQTGVIDGAENNYPSYLTSSHFEVAKYFTEDGHLRVPELTVASQMTIDKLSKEDIEIIKQAAKDAVPVQIAAWNKFSDEAKQKVIDAGCKVTELSPEVMAQFQAAVAPLYEEFAADYKDDIKRIQETK